MLHDANLLIRSWISLSSFADAKITSNDPVIEVGRNGRWEGRIWRMESRTKVKANIKKSFVLLSTSER